MTFLRTVPTQRLLAIIAGVIVAIAAGTTIAVAAAGSGPVPAPKPLASAIHGALAATPPSGISADITFTNNLISSTDVTGDTDPLLLGATGRLWATKGHFRLELQSDNGDAQVVADDSSFWVYDPSSNTVYKGDWSALDPGAKDHSASSAGPKASEIPTVARIEQYLGHLARHLDISGAEPTDVAGQAAYRVTVSPKHDGGLLGDAQLAWDAIHGVPLDLAIYAAGDTTPVLELKATGISYGPVPLSDFAISPPPDAKVVTVSKPTAAARSAHRHALADARRDARITGVAAVAGKVDFSLTAPATLAGLPRRDVSLLDWGGSPAALLLYGQGPGGLAVIERSATGRGTSSTHDGQSGLNLPSVSIDGATAQELDTELGTAIQFTRSGVGYVVIGSVPPAAAEAAARDL
jgi:hypothetical protein